jgi:hypothetical protein
VQSYVEEVTKKYKAKMLAIFFFQKGAFTFTFCFNQVVFVFSHSSNYYIFF